MVEYQLVLHHSMGGGLVQESADDGPPEPEWGSWFKDRNPRPPLPPARQTQRDVRHYIGTNDQDDNNVILWSNLWLSVDNKWRDDEQNMWEMR